MFNFVRLFLTVGLLSNLVGSIVRADTFDDRQALAGQKKLAAAVAAEIANQHARDLEFVALVKRFAGTHSGLAATPECFSTNYNAPAWPYYNNAPASVRQICGKGTCIHVHEDSIEFNPSLEYQALYFQETFVEYCKIQLRNDLACQFSETGDRLDQYDAHQ